MIRVCILMHSYGGGAEPLALWLAANLNPQRFQVSVHCLRHVPALAKAAEKAEVGFSMPRGTSLCALVAHMLAVSALARRCDVVVGSLELQSIFWAALVAPGRTVAWLHKHIGGYLAGKPRAYVWLYRVLLGWALRRSVLTACVSRGIMESSRQLWPSITKKLRLAWNPVDSGDLARRARTSLPAGLASCFSAPVILAVGRLEPQKAFHLLLEAHALLRERGINQHVCIAGNGSQRAFLERRARELGVEDSVWLPGFVDPAPLMGRARVLAVSSLFEGCPLVMVEALSAGLPIVAADCPAGPREIIEDGRWGTLVPMNDAVALANALENTLRNPPDATRRRELMQRAAAFAPAPCLSTWECLLEEAAS